MHTYGSQSLSGQGGGIWEREGGIWEGKWGFDSIRPPGVEQLILMLIV